MPMYRGFAGYGLTPGRAPSRWAPRPGGLLAQFDEPPAQEGPTGLVQALLEGDAPAGNEQARANGADQDLPLWTLSARLQALNAQPRAMDTAGTGNGAMAPVGRPAPWWSTYGGGIFDTLARVWPSYQENPAASASPLVLKPEQARGSFENTVAPPRSSVARFEPPVSSEPDVSARPNASRPDPTPFPPNVRFRKPPIEWLTDRSDTLFHSFVREFQKAGLENAARYLEHYLAGSGKPIILNRDELRSFEPMRNAEATNSKRFEKAFLDFDRKHGQGWKLVELKDGETINVSDNWDVAYGHPSFLFHLARPSTRDFAFSMGRTALGSGGDFEVTRHGNTIYITGTVAHNWNDRFDFNEGQPHAQEAFLLEKYRGAKPFDRRAQWKTRVTGTIQIDGEQLSNPRFKWEDVDE